MGSIILFAKCHIGCIIKCKVHLLNFFMPCPTRQSNVKRDQINYLFSISYNCFHCALYIAVAYSENVVTNWIFPFTIICNDSNFSVTDARDGNTLLHTGGIESRVM